MVNSNCLASAFAWNLNHVCSANDANLNGIDSTSKMPDSTREKSSKSSTIRSRLSEEFRIDSTIIRAWRGSIGKSAIIFPIVESELSYDPCPLVKEGQMVKVVSGPLKGVVGRLVRKGAHARLVLSVDLIGQAVSVEVDAADVRPY